MSHCPRHDVLKEALSGEGSGRTRADCYSASERVVCTLPLQFHNSGLRIWAVHKSSAWCKAMSCHRKIFRYSIKQCWNCWKCYCVLFHFKRHSVDSTQYSTESFDFSILCSTWKKIINIVHMDSNMSDVELHRVTLFVFALKALFSRVFPAIFRVLHFSMSLWTTFTISELRFKISETARLRRWIAHPSSGTPMSHQKASFTIQLSPVNAVIFQFDFSKTDSTNFAKLMYSAAS